MQVRGCLVDAVLGVAFSCCAVHTGLMSDEDPNMTSFSAVSGTPGAAFGGLQDPTSVSVTLSGFTYGQEAGWEWFTNAAARHKKALDNYLMILRSSNGDVTDPRVKVAATELHKTIGALPTGHAAYAGVGFPSPNYETPTAPRSDLDDGPPPARTMTVRIHPHVDTALSGSRRQRLDLAEQPHLPVEVELILARDPATDVRREFVFTGTRSRIAMLLMERDETNDEVRDLFVNQRYASADLKMDVPLVDLYRDSLEGVADLLGLEDELRLRLLASLDETDRGDEQASRSTLRNSLGSLGWKQETSP